METIEIQVLKLRYKLKGANPKLSESALDLLISSLSDYNPNMPTGRVPDWLNEISNKIVFKVKRVPLAKIQSWNFDKYKNITHTSGKFFKIRGIKVTTNVGETQDWAQPIIEQPEVGILGILCQKRSGILYFLIQAKTEPGNINKVQLSPTVQATRSNFTQVHGGSLPPYLDYFLKLDDKKIIVDQLQSEQGARFLKKRNRNMIIEVNENTEIPLHENFCWLTLGQIKKLLEYDNIINMDARTVLSCTQLKFN